MQKRLVALLCLSLIFLSAGCIFENEESPTAVDSDELYEEEGKPVKVDIILRHPGGADMVEVELDEGKSAFDALYEWHTQDYNIRTLEYDYDSEQKVFIKSIQDYRSGDGWSWVLFINGERQSGSPGLYVVKNGDSVVFEYMAD